MFFDVEDRLPTDSTSDYNEAENAVNREEEENISVNDLFEERQEDVSDAPRRKSTMRDSSQPGR